MSTTEEQTTDPQEQLLKHIDGVVRGELPFGLLFGLDADDIHAFADLADDLLAAGRLADALLLYEGCVQLDPLDVTLLCGYATTLMHSGDATASRQVTDLVLQLAPDDAAVHAFLRGTHLLASDHRGSSTTPGS